MSTPNGDFSANRMNPGVQARLLAFQQRRQQLQKGQQPSIEDVTTPTSTTPTSTLSPSPVITPDDQPLRRTSFRLASSEKQDKPDELGRRTSFRLNKPKSEEGQQQQQQQQHQQSPQQSSNDIELRRNNSYHQSSTPGNVYHINKSVEYITKVKEQANRSRSGSRPNSTSNFNEPMVLPEENPNAQGTTKLSLSQRRGLKLDFNSLSPTLDNKETNLSSPLGNLEDSVKNISLGSVQQRMKKNSLPDRGKLRRKPEMKMDINPINGNTNNKPMGMFASYSKYIDIKSGSLNFSGKASLHSKGIDFSNGSSFRISMEDLEFQEELGRGNYGVVSKVLHKPTGIVMAMKEVRLELDDSKFSQILMELEVLHSCKSDCIVEFYGAFFIEGAVYMCMEYMMGGSIDKVYGNGIGEVALAYITKRVVQGLRELKDQHNIIHRDVKPTNMLVSENGKVKLCDFGVSGNLVASLARTNIGCQSYMAPERIKSVNPDVNTYSVQSDIWSLGLSILEIAKGCYPYSPETYNNVFSQLSAIVDGEPPELPPGQFSNEAQDFVAQCLNKNPQRRPPYAQLVQHKWLNMYKEEDGQREMAKIVAEKGKKGSQESNKAVPALHRGLGSELGSLN